MKTNEIKKRKKDWILWGLVLLNILIVILGEVFSEAFITFGIMDLLALGLIVLTIYRITTRMGLTDPVLGKFAVDCLIALLLFALSIICWLIGLGEYHQTNASNFVMGGIVSIIIGTEVFLQVYEKRSILLMRFLQFMALGFAAVATTALINYEFVDFYLGGVRDYLYAPFMFVVAAIGIYRLYKIRKVVPVVRGLATATMVVVVLAVIATLPEILFVSLAGVVSAYYVQVTLVTHFLFLAALSALYLAFERLRNPGGVYSEF